MIQAHSLVAVIGLCNTGSEVDRVMSLLGIQH